MSAPPLSLNRPLSVPPRLVPRALRMLADAGIPLGNQSVLLRDVNDCPLIMRELVHRLAARRPDQRAVFHPTMRVTHLEFVRARDRTRRLSLYTRTNSQIATFRELEARRRLGLLWMLVRRLALG
mgnify:CR=1 FL=1